MPLISIVIPAYNRAHFLPETLESALGQSISDIECIVVDDGSTDDTFAVLERFRERDPRVRYLRQDNRGPSAARNYGLAESRGRYIQFLDSDDIIAQDKLARQMAQLDGIEELALSYCDYRYCAHDDVHKSATRDTFPPPRFITQKPLWDIASRWETGLSIPMHCFLFDARFFRDQGIQFDENLSDHEDWDCWLRIFALEPTVLHVPAELAIYRLHSDAITVNHVKLKLGFTKAIRKQQRFFRRDAMMSKILAIKLSEQGVRPSRRRMIFDALCRIYAKSIPWPIQRMVFKARQIYTDRFNRR